MSDAGVDRAKVARRLWVLSEMCQQLPDNSEHPFTRFRVAKTALSRAKAQALLRAPIRDPQDETRKMTGDDREAWTLAQPEVIAAEDELVVAESAWNYYQEQTWARKDEAEYLRTLSADARADMALL
ncbi:hypothetical protein L3Y19_gp061 [Gordonia phage Neville]|uniref:Uncharacterized protein n=2 Tax=Nevillevirus TaxID=3044773 RepID=A0A515MH21_9CAUD|nr:hypothetical protein L3Y19_gp061 [Gordonia phage Neville]YP_010246045.1 hypothetical protein L3Y20_gp060 [Gordonia phage Trax]AXQ64430.1 hypothetical protein SEA_NEVILLE_61 [Gordonia phage Neville]QDM55947.1 hypothetical protein SEA_TRAX_60 [Gordonia phage Trax]